MSEKVLRYPESLGKTAEPWVMFTKQKATYTKETEFKSKVITNDMGYVALYMPMSISINDNMVYENTSTGIFGGAFELGKDAFSIDSYSALDAKALAVKYGSDVAAAIGGGVAAKASSAVGGGAVGQIISGVLGAGTLSNAAAAGLAEYQKDLQTVLNPREFMLFKSPSLRQFSFRFRFMPESEKESKVTEDIIKWFRTGAYPEVSSNFTYRFPNAFKCEFRNIKGVIQIPELYLENVSVSYNPNSMSYFKSKDGNRPIEFNLGLDFKELQPISSKSVEGGF